MRGPFLSTAALGLLAAALAGAGCSSTPGMGPPNGMGGSMGSNSCTPGRPTLTGTLAGRYGVIAFVSEGREYYLQVNQWNTNADGTQTLSYGGDSFFTMTQQTATAATNGGPTGFPSIFTGANSGRYTDDSNMPKKVSDLTTVPTSWTWDDGGTLSDQTHNTYNATYDVWFSTSAAGDPSAGSPSGGFLMVWYYKPPLAQPIGQVRYPAVSIPGVPGTWDVWIGPNNGKPVTSYVATSHIQTLSYDLNAFIQDAVKNRQYNSAPAISSDWYLTNIFAGFEIWSGGVNLATTSFCAVVN
jgi:hypothetical protein